MAKQKKTVPADFDLSELDKFQQAQEDGADIEIMGPDGTTPLGFVITIAGPDSERRKAEVQAIQDEYIEAEDASIPTTADNMRNVMRVDAAATIKWSTFRLDGAEYPCTKENAMKLYQRFPTIYRQVARKGGSTAVFTKSWSESLKEQ